MSDNPFATGTGNSKKLEQGEVVQFTVLNYSMVNSTNLNTGAPEQVPVLGCQPADGTPAFDLWCGKPGLKRAIGTAMAEAGHNDVPQVGAKMRIERVADTPPSKPGHSPMHTFVAQYQSPASPAPVGGNPFGEQAQAPSPAPAAEVPAQPAPAPAPAQDAAAFFSS